VDRALPLSKGEVGTLRAPVPETVSEEKEGLLDIPPRENAPMASKSAPEFARDIGRGEFGADVSIPPNRFKDPPSKLVKLRTASVSKLER